MIGKRYIWFVVLCCLTACTQRGLHEAQAVVAEADSLWHNGQMYDDSATLAHAYNELGKWQRFYPDEYAHACYHYGKLLRTKDDPVAAMQCFIHATHTRTSDYHILGRVYSNMGDICHYADEFALSYDMFERSADMFLKNGDTLLYYYDLNNMAYELAEQAKREETLTLLSNIEEHCNDSYAALKTLETKSRLYLKCEQYDSSLYYAQRVLSESPNYSAAALLVAQSYSFLGISDSATVYANKVLSSQSDKLYETNNALYILTSDDATKDINAVRQTAADRADIQKILEIRQGKLSQAVQLLEQDLNRKPDLRWVYAIISTLIVISTITGLYVRRKRKKQTLLSQQIEHLETTFTDLRATRENQIEQMCATLRASTNLQNDLSWKDFDKLCALVNEHFFLLAGKLKQTAVLNETEIRLCILVLIGLSRIEIANTLPYALNSVGKLKDHTAKLLGTTGKNLRIFLLKMAIE